MEPTPVAIKASQTRSAAVLVLLTTNRTIHGDLQSLASFTIQKLLRMGTHDFQQTE